MEKNVKERFLRKCWNDLLVLKPDLFTPSLKRLSLVNQCDGDLVEGEKFCELVQEEFKTEVINISDGFLFISNQEAQAAVSLANEKFPNTKWQVLPKIVPLVEENSFMLETDAEVTVNDIHQLLSHVDGTGTENNPDIIKWKKAFRVVYPDANTNLENIKSSLQSSQVKGNPILVKDYCCSDCIKISNLPQDVEAEISKTLTSIERCRITNVVKCKNNSTAFVYYANYHDAKHMVEKLGGPESQKVLEEAWNGNVKFELYYHYPNIAAPLVLTGQTEALDETDFPPRKLDEYENNLRQSSNEALERKLPDSPAAETALEEGSDMSFSNTFDGTQNVEASFELMPDAPYGVMELIHDSQRLHKQLETMFKTVKPEVIKKICKRTKITYSVKVTVSSEQSQYAVDGRIFEEKCMKRLNEFLSKFVTKSEKFEIDKINDLRRQKNWDTREAHIIAFQEDNDDLHEVYVRWNDGETGKVTISGLEPEVDLALKKMKTSRKSGSPSRDIHSAYSPSRDDSTRTTSNVIRLNNDVIRWITKFAVDDPDCSAVLRKVRITPLTGGSGVEIVGEKDECTRAQHLIKELAPQLQTDTHRLRAAEDFRFFTSSDGETLVKEIERNAQCAISITRRLAPQPKKFKPKPEPGQIICSGKLNVADVTVRVMQVDITKMRCDAIVNTSNRQLELRAGGVSGSILRKGGHSIQREMDDIIDRRRYLPAGEAVTTGAGELPCLKIIHVVGPTWYGRSDFKDNERCVMKCVQSILAEADAFRLSSVAIPAISCGVFGGDVTVCTALMVEAIVEYFAAKYDSYVKRIDLVELCDEYTLFLFKNCLEGVSVPESASTCESTSGRSESPTSPSYERDRNSVKIGEVTLLAKQGDITNEKCDAIVNPTSAGYQLDVGQVGSSIVAKDDGGIRKECKNLLKQTKSQPTFLATNAGNLPCSKIYHFPVLKQPQLLQSALLKLLCDAERKGIRTVALPAIGSKVFPIDVLINILTSTVDQFASTDPQSLREVRLVIYDYYYAQQCGKMLTEEAQERRSVDAHDDDSPGRESEHGSVTLCAKTYEQLGEAWETLKQCLPKHQPIVEPPLPRNSVTLPLDDVSVCQDDITDLEAAFDVLIGIRSERDKAIIEVQGSRAEEALEAIKRTVAQHTAHPSHEMPPYDHKQRPGASHYPGIARRVEVPYESESPKPAKEYRQDNGSKILKFLGKQNHKAGSSFSGDSVDRGSNSQRGDRKGSYDSSGVPMNKRQKENGKQKEESSGLVENALKELQRTRKDLSKKWSGEKKKEIKKNAGVHMDENRQVTSTGPEWEHWKLIDTNQWTLAQVAEGGVEYKEVMSKFRSGSSYIKTVIKLEQVKNPSLYQNFEKSKNTGVKTSEMFHGVRSEARSLFICQNGWNTKTELVGKKSGQWSGTVFRANPAAAVEDQDTHGRRRMFLAEVVRIEQRKGEMATVFNNTSAYPAYLLTYKAY